MEDLEDAIGPGMGCSLFILKTRELPAEGGGRGVGGGVQFNESAECWRFEVKDNVFRTRFGHIMIKNWFEMSEASTEDWGNLKRFRHRKS